MMNVLITGKSGYIGNALADWLAQWPDLYCTTIVSLRGEGWKTQSFRGYDVVFHGAGLAHDHRAPTEEYDSANRRLAIDAAEKAKSDGVRRFLLMSTMAVYGNDGVVGQKNEIGPNTAPDPQSAYGRSKYAAELGIMALHDENFAVGIVRAPMVYGANCPGNYGRLRELALRYGIVPLVENERSMIYIDHLCEFLRLCMHLDGDKTVNRTPQSGIYCPRDEELFCTGQAMAWIAQANHRAIRRSKLLGLCLKPAGLVIPGVRKAFGNLTYDKGLSIIPIHEYSKLSLKEAITATEAGWTGAHTARME